MRITLPFAYQIGAMLGRSTTIKDYRVYGEEEVEIREADEADFPLAVSWKLDALWDDTEPRETHTRFAEGSHWQELGITADELRNAPAYNALLKIKKASKFCRRHDAEGVLDIGRNEGFYNDDARTTSVELAKVPEDRMNDKAKRKHQSTRFTLHSFALDLMLCNGMLYQRRGEPVLAVSRMAEHRGPDTVFFHVSDANAEIHPRVRKALVALYTHRVDRLDDFSDVVAEHPPQGEIEVINLINYVNVHLPDSITYDDDREALNATLKNVRESLMETPGGNISNEIINFCRQLNSPMTADQQEDAFRKLQEEPSLFKADGFESVRDQIDLVASRWRMRPMTAFNR